MERQANIETKFQSTNNCEQASHFMSSPEQPPAPESPPEATPPARASLFHDLGVERHLNWIELYRFKHKSFHVFGRDSFYFTEILFFLIPCFFYSILKKDTTPLILSIGLAAFQLLYYRNSYITDVIKLSKESEILRYTSKNPKLIEHYDQSLTLAIGVWELYTNRSFVTWLVYFELMKYYMLSHCLLFLAFEYLSGSRPEGTST